MKKVKEGEGSSKNFYAITNGRCTGIYKAWSQVKPLVDKYPGAAFKGFASLDEAVEFMQKGGFAETDIRIYEIEDEILTRSGESENIPAVEERSVFEDCTEETNVKLCDAQEFSSENTQGACNDSENHKKAHCVMCKSGESKEMLQCSACNGRVHLLCSGLPKYQIMVFRNTQRKFMCQSCVENSSEIKMKNARKSYTELRDDDHQSTTERQDGSNHTNQHQPCAENFGEIKREIGNINLTLSNFEQEILKVITQMRNENLSLREKECIERVKSAESLRDSIVEQKEKAENCNKELTTQIGNLKDKITKLQTETDNLRKHAATSAEIQKRLEEEVKQKDAEISELQGRNQALECEKKVPSFNFHEQQPNSQSQQLNVNEISVCSYETSNRFECLDSEVRQEPLSGDNCIYVKGHRDPLSNFFRMRFIWDNHTYNSVEQAFQHEKAMRHRYYDLARKIKAAKHAGIAHKIGRSVELHPRWDDDKETIMQEMLMQKHVQCAEFRQVLANSSGKIILDAPDRFWGIGSDSRGMNRLGSILEKLRNKTRSERGSAQLSPKPKVAIFGSSLIKNMRADRFSRRVSTEIQISYTIPEAKKHIKEYDQRADVVVYQLLSNDLKSKSVEACIKEMKELVEITKSRQRDSKIIVSLPTNRGDDMELNHKTNMVNAKVKIEFLGDERVYVSDNSNLAYRGEPNNKLISQHDGVHPTAHGEKVLFQNIRRAVEEVCFP